MAGTLQQHPYYKTYDEIQRSAKRMQTYLRMNELLLSAKEHDDINMMVEKMEEILDLVPDMYRVTKHFLKDK